MGLFNSKSESNEYQEIGDNINKLNQRLSNLERLDNNNDGMITKDEIEQWMERQKQDLLEFKTSIEEQARVEYQKMLVENERELNEANLRIKELKKELRSVKHINRSLEKQLRHKPRIEITNAATLPTQESQLSLLSKQQINQFVEKILKNKDINIKYLPDAVEKQIYRNVFTMLINILDNLMETAEIRFLGHNISLDLRPNVDTNEDEENINDDELIDV